MKKNLNNYNEADNEFLDNDMTDKLSRGNDRIGNYTKYVNMGNDIANNNMIDNRSIVARSKNSIMQFPVYISKSVMVKEAQLISQMFERVYATLVQTVLSQNQYIDADKANNLNFLKKFHTNINESSDLFIEKYYNEYYEPIDHLDSFFVDSILYEADINDNLSVTFSYLSENNKYLSEESRRSTNEMLKGFPSLIQYTEALAEDVRSKSTTVNKNVLNENDFDEMAKEVLSNHYDPTTLSILDMNDSEIKRQAEVISNSNDISVEDAENNLFNSKAALSNDMNITKRVIKDYINDKSINMDVMNNLGYSREEAIRMMNSKFKSIQYSGGKYFRVSTTQSTRIENPMPVSAPEILRDGDIKKINSMLPYTIKATFRVRTKNGEIDRDVVYIIGVKSILHSVDMSELQYDLDDIINGKNKTLRKIKYKTGEINFLDYLFNFTNLKADAAKNLNTDRRWINTLKRLGEFKATHGTFWKNPLSKINKGMVPIPNGTLIFTTKDIEVLKNTTGIDLMQISNVKKLCNSLFLIAVAVINSAAGAMDVFFIDRDNDWETQSLASVEAELNKVDNKAVVSELNRMVNRR